MHSTTRGKIDSNIYALRDVSFDVPEGAGLGIIGRNGAGKTTLLKLISRVSWPTSGTVRVAGHVVSLIELGAGFHPELTGRENVYLGAGLFGLTRSEIDRQFDAIVHFADVEHLIDTPMKRYSSGLYARLGFSVAIHSRPDIVLVDEVLSVGDAAFRRRALEALRALIAGGKTVLFISHDMWNVRRLCSQILWMEEGRVRAAGPAAEIAERYMNEVNLQALADQATSLQAHRGGTGEVRFATVDTADAHGNASSLFASGDALVVRASYVAATAVDPTGLPGRHRRRGHRRDRHERDLRRTADSGHGGGSRRNRDSIRSPAASPAPVRAATVDHRRPAAGVVRPRHCRSTVRRDRSRRRRRQPCRRAGRPGLAAVRGRPSNCDRHGEFKVAELKVQS